MLTLLWNLSAAIRGSLRFYMPTNRAVDWLSTPRGLKWAIPLAILATPAYLFAMSIFAVLTQRSGIEWLNILVLLYFWNAMKFAWLAVLTPFRWWAFRLCPEPLASHEDKSEFAIQTQPVHVARTMTRS